MHHPTQLLARESAVLVIDVQEKLMAKIPTADAITRTGSLATSVEPKLSVTCTATVLVPAFAKLSLTVGVVPVSVSKVPLPSRSHL